MDSLLDSLYAAADPVNELWIGFWRDVIVANTTEWFRVCLLSSATYIALFWVANVFLIFFNFFPGLNPLERWKIQKGEYETGGKVAEMAGLVLFNQLMTFGLQSLAYDAAVERGVQTGVEGLPHVVTMVFYVFICIVGYDFFFFVSHCAMHTKWLYYNIHQTHHTSKHSFGLTAAYFHPIDYLTTTLSAFITPALISPHVSVQWVFGLLLLFESTNAHSGFHIPFLPDARDHDFHHSHSNYASKKYRFVNMGSFFLIFDRLFGTREPCLAWWREKEGKKEQ
eukprot:TRINITY_DN3643_c0_g3_i1.p1 TRINITY_DN3643_c0_g3~~TRINITY_DN3643_c0_g3_i1.p1  ORF type:complete len:293 (+),score=79.45 TRINITY_DN3643_c0_g3_i1:38-880(+)